MKKKRKPSKRLGLKRMPLTADSCFVRAEELRDLERLARTWANWYRNKGKKLLAEKLS
jgi:hypothetical protein